MFLGKIQENPCRISAKSQNNSVLITGISGSGKTCRMQEMEIDSAKNGHTAIVFDTADSHTDDQIFSLFKKKYISLLNRISAVHDGLCIPLFSLSAKTNLQTESNFLLINSIANSFARPYKLGELQTGILRSSIQYALQNHDRFPSDLEAISHGLHCQGTEGKKVYQRLWSIFNCGALRQSEKHFCPGKINVLDFGGLDALTRKVITELILVFLFENAHDSKNIYTIFLDECQNYSLKPDGIICQLLREGRKFNINTVLSTQTLSVFNCETVSILNQASTKLYFQPALADINKVAKQISHEDWKKWKSVLLKLSVGECIACGYFNIGNAELQRPILLH